jgi:Domain of unknown function (DUF4424)
LGGLCDDAKTMKCVLIEVLCLLSCIPAAFGNGGGYSRGGVEKAGDLAGFEPKMTENIRMLDEKLTIKLGPKEADVEVRYVMRNVTDKKMKVRFGFPVEESFDLTEWSADRVKYLDGNRLAYCKNYQITEGGRQVKSIWEKERVQTEGPEFKGVAGWMVSEVTFSANEEKPVMIRFQSAYPEDSSSVSEDESISGSIFRYRLSSAACWAGMIGTGRIVIEPNGIHPDDVRVLKPVNRFKKEGSRWVWNFEELEPTLADDMEIQARPKEFSYGLRTWSGGHQGANTKPGDLVDFIERGDKWSVRHSNYKVKASSTLKEEGVHSYGPDNIRDPFQEAVWSEGVPGSGVGEWLEITPVEAKPLIGLEMKPGYQKEGLFKANARPKKIRIELNGEHVFDADIPDREEQLEIPVIGYARAVRKIRMTFTEVYPGEKFEDLCISTIRLHARLDKKPKITPSR